MQVDQLWRALESHLYHQKTWSYSILKSLKTREQHQPVVFFRSPASSACSGTWGCLGKSASMFSPSGLYERLPPHCHTEIPLDWTVATKTDTEDSVRLHHIWNCFYLCFMGFSSCVGGMHSFSRLILLHDLCIPVIFEINSIITNIGKKRSTAAWKQK